MEKRGGVEAGVDPRDLDDITGRKQWWILYSEGVDLNRKRKEGEAQASDLDLLSCFLLEIRDYLGAIAIDVNESRYSEEQSGEENRDDDQNSIAAKVYSARAPSCGTFQGRLAVRTCSATPSVKRLASGIIFSNAAGVRTCSSVARIAASESALPASVPPMPPTSQSSSCMRAEMRCATSSVQPYVPPGMPLPIGFPKTTKSGSSFHSRVQPPGPAQMVWVSSSMRSAP